MRCLVVSLLAVLVATGCKASVEGDCDEALARTPYYSAGQPAFSGQALLVENCAGCHGATTSFGAPLGLDFDVRVLRGQDVDATIHLLDAQQNVHAKRDTIYDQVVRGWMPPEGFAQPTTFCRTPREDGSCADAPQSDRLPTIDSPEAHEMLRNWLACGSPVVERTQPWPRSCDTDADCPVTGRCNLDAGRNPPGFHQCYAVGDLVPSTIDCTTPVPQWGWIFSCVVAGTSGCAGAICHDSERAGGLELRTADQALDALIGHAPTGDSPDCEGAPPYVVPGDPDGSLLVHKLVGVDGEGARVCGSRMPLLPPYRTAGEIEAIRSWIAELPTE